MTEEKKSPVTLYDRFEERFKMFMHGDFHLFYEHLPATDVYSFLTYVQMEVNDRVISDRLISFLFGAVVGIAIGLLAFAFS